MRELYHEQLDQVSDDLIEMTRLVASAMNRATQALLDADLQLAEGVIAGDDAIDAIASKVEADCFQVQARQQPVATDLRIIVAALRISASLERMGDLASHIAKSARMRYPGSAIPAQLRPTFQAMGAVAQNVVSKAGSVIATKDITMAADVARTDEDMDRLHRELFQVVLSPTWEFGVETAVDVTLLSRFYERFADHAVTIAKRVVYVATGEPYADVDPEALAEGL
ncbi:MAG: phosphate signaling complex protein PhoU [Frankiales bacterium]|nr:phosphate signaling complex protein PhoU [Frankiales bacterium]